MSLLRKQKRAAGRKHIDGKGARNSLDLMLFRRLPAPNHECEVERRELAARFEQIAKSFKSHAGKRLWDYFLRCHEKYSPSKDGESANMQLVESVLALREVEREELRCVAAQSESSSAGAA